MNWHVLDAVFKRNFVAYFSSPTGYVFICVFVLLGSLAAFWPPEFFNSNLANLDQLEKLVLPDTAADGQRLLTFRPNLLERQLISPLGLGYHAEHHIFPSVPYYALPEVARLVQGNPAVEERRSYLGFVVECLRRLPLPVSRDPREEHGSA